jgi:hypothetical protein
MKRQYEITATASSKQFHNNPSDGNPSPRAHTQKHHPPKSTSLSSSQAKAFIAKHQSQKETIARSEGPISEILLESSTHDLVICESPHRVISQLASKSRRLALPRHALPLAKGLALLLFLFLDLGAQLLCIIVELVKSRAIDLGRSFAATGNDWRQVAESRVHVVGRVLVGEGAVDFGLAASVASGPRRDIVVADVGATRASGD